MGHSQRLWNLEQHSRLHRSCCGHIVSKCVFGHGSFASREDYHGTCQCTWRQRAECILSACLAMVDAILFHNKGSISHATGRSFHANSYYLHYSDTFAGCLRLLRKYNAEVVWMALSWCVLGLRCLFYFTRSVAVVYTTLSARDVSSCASCAILGSVAGIFKPLL